MRRLRVDGGGELGEWVRRTLGGDERGGRKQEREVTRESYRAKFNKRVDPASRRALPAWAVRTQPAQSTAGRAILSEYMRYFALQQESCVLTEVEMTV